MGVRDERGRECAKEREREREDQHGREGVCARVCEKEHKRDRTRRVR